MKRLILVFGVATAPSLAPSAPGRAASVPCAEQTRASFAWWVGSWSYSVPGYDSAVSTVTSTKGGCRLLEEFVDRGGQKQHTTIEYDGARHEWRRTVVDPFRTYQSAGNFAADGSVAFYETPTDRETYKPIDRDHVHFLGEKSDDGGKRWRVLFDAVYMRRP